MSETLICLTCNGSGWIDAEGFGGSTVRACPDCNDAMRDIPPDEEDSSIQQRFMKFHRQNPKVYGELVRLAREARRAGIEQVGISLLYEVIRWNSMIQTGGDHFKLSNDYRSRYARLIMHKERDLRGIFHTRPLREEKADAIAADIPPRDDNDGERPAEPVACERGSFGRRITQRIADGVRSTQRRNRSAHSRHDGRDQTARSA